MLEFEAMRWFQNVGGNFDTDVFTHGNKVNNCSVAI